MQKVIALCLVLVLALPSPSKAVDPKIVKVEVPHEVASWVLTDLLTIPVNERIFYRYVWIPSWSDIGWNDAVSYAFNATISRSGTIHKPTLIANGWVQRWDMRLLLPDDPIFLKVIQEYDRLALEDPYFHDQGSLDNSVSVRNLSLLSAAGMIDVPVVRADWIVTKMLTSIEGGRYLELRGIEGNEAQVLSRFGVFEEQAKLVDGDRRVGMFRSGVTGKARSVLALNTLLGQAWITEDLFDEDVNDNNHPIQNLLDNPYRGREIIIEMSNGLHLFLITDDKGTILREAPPNLVTDHRVPAPNTKRLQGGAISCIRCHGDESGLKSCSNDVATILAGPLRLQGDARFVDDVITRYSGRKFDRSILLGRENYEAAIDRLSNGRYDAAKMADLLSDIYARYRYDMVTIDTALMELGFDIEAEGFSAKEVFREILEFDAGIGLLGILEDPSIAALTQGIPIRRSDFDRVHSRLAYRTARIRDQIQEVYRVESN